jgi:tetratricopeptide (TPR) repeat protein
MMRLRVADVRKALPELDELRPLLDHLLERSVPDSPRQWSGSGELQTADARLVTADDLERALTAVASQEYEHLSRIYGAVGQAIARLGAGEHDAAASQLLDAARLEEGRNRPDRAEAYAAAASRVAKSGGSAGTAALALRRQARATRALGRLMDAERLYAAGHSLAAAVGDHRGAAEAAIGAGNVLEEQGQWTGSAGWYHTALDLLEPAGELVPESWHAHLNMHVVLRSRGEVEESVRWLRQAEQIANALKDDSAAAFILNAWGQLHMARGAFPLAKKYLRDALLLCEGPRARVIIRLNLAEALLAQGRTLDAAEEAREAERDALAAGLAAKLPEVYRLLGRIAAAGRNPDAFVLFEHALHLIRDQAPSVLEEAITLQAYGEAMSRSGQNEVAQELQERALELFRTIGIEGPRKTWVDSYGAAETADHGGEPT